MPLPPLLRDEINHRSILKSVRSQIHSGKRARHLGITVATRSVCEHQRRASFVHICLRLFYFIPDFVESGRIVESRYCELHQAKKLSKLSFQRANGVSNIEPNEQFIQTENLNPRCDNLKIQNDE